MVLTIERENIDILYSIFLIEHCIQKKKTKNRVRFKKVLFQCFKIYINRCICQVLIQLELKVVLK